MSNSAYGVKGDSEGVGNGSLAYYAPGASFTGNVVIGGSASSYTSYPGNYFPGSVSFVNPSTGNYAISGANPYGAAGDQFINVTAAPPVVTPPIATPPTVTIASAGGTTSSAAQTITGTADFADVGSTVTVFDGTTAIGTGTVAASGAWSANVTLANQGANVLTATDANAAGTGTSNAVDLHASDRRPDDQRDGAGQATTSEAAVKPFSGVTIADPNSGASDTLTITVSGAGGTLSGTGLSGGSGGVYTLSGTAAAVTSALDALSFAPKAGSPGTSSTTTFTLSDLSNADATATVNTTTSVVDKDPAAAPTIGGTVAGQATTSEAAVKPFSGVTIADPNSGASDTLTITVAGAGGTLSGTGLGGGSGGVYTLSGTAAAVTSALDALSFAPKAGSPGTSSTTTFTLSDLSSAYATATVNTTTSVVDKDPAAAPTPAPAVTAVTTSPAKGTEVVGSSITFTVTMSEAVTVAGGAPTLALNDGGTAKYAGGSGSNALTFSYTVGATDIPVASLAVAAVNLPYRRHDHRRRRQRGEHGERACHVHGSFYRPSGYGRLLSRQPSCARRGGQDNDRRHSRQRFGKLRRAERRRPCRLDHALRHGNSRACSDGRAGARGHARARRDHEFVLRDRRH